MPWAWSEDEFRIVVAALLALTFIVGGLLQGYRLDRFIWHRFPDLAAKLPTDIGCWLGLVIGVVGAIGALA